MKCIVGAIVGGVLFWFLGALFYGILFAEIWNEVYPVVVEDYDSMSLLYGLLQTILLSMGLVMVLHWKNDEGVMKNLVNALWFSLFFAIAIPASDLIHVPNSTLSLFFVDVAYLTIGFCLVAVSSTFVGRFFKK